MSPFPRPLAVSFWLLLLFLAEGCATKSPPAPQEAALRAILTQRKLPEGWRIVHDHTSAAETK